MRPTFSVESSVKLTFAPFLLVMSVLYLKARDQLNAKAE